MSITAMLEPIAGNGEPVTLPAQEWLQGRTLYGGASALIAYTAAIRAFPDLPPLRSAQVAFVAPVGADVTPRAEIIRQGRNVTQVRMDLLYAATSRRALLLSSRCETTLAGAGTLTG